MATLNQDNAMSPVENVLFQGGADMSDKIQSSPGDVGTDDGFDHLQDGILDGLQPIQTTGSFASFAPLSSNHNPRIHVRDVGEIRLPLCEEQARQIINKAHQAPYGKGSETLVDTSVRNTWELEPSSFFFEEPERWQETLQSLKQSLAATLGMAGVEFQAELYKMLVYETGAMFKAHTDTEKIPGMFGTMVISLPSAHEGGDVVVKHGGQKLTFKTSSVGVGLSSVLAWYSDVQHEVLPVTSGYRWVLTYNLALPSEYMRPSAGLLRGDLRPLRHALRKWLLALDNGVSSLDRLYYRMDHQYTEAQLSLKNLKTTDFAMISTLHQMSSELGLDIFLAVIEKQETRDCEFDGYDPFDEGGYYDESEEEEDDDEDDEEEKAQKKDSSHSMDDLIDTSYNFKRIVDLEGQLLLSGISTDEDFEKKMLQQCDPFEDADDEEEEVAGYTGNEVRRCFDAPNARMRANQKQGQESYHWYRSTVAVIVPRKYTSKLLLSDFCPYSKKSRQERDGLINYFADRCSNLSTRAAAFACIQDLFRATWNYRPSDSSATGIDPSLYPKGDVLLRALDVALDLEQVGFFEEIMTQYGKDVPVAVFARTREQMDKGTIPDGSTIERSLSKVITTYPNIRNRCRALNAVVPPNTTIPDCFHDLADRVLTDAVSTCFEAGKGSEDAHALFDMIHDYKDPTSPLFEEAMRNIGIDQLLQHKLGTRQASFSLAALNGIHKMVSEGFISTEQGEKAFMYETRVQLFITELDIGDLVPAKIEPPPKVPRYMYRPMSTSRGFSSMDEPLSGLRDISSAPSANHTKPPMPLETLTQFTEILLKKEDQKLAHAFFEKLGSQVDQIPTTDFPGLWLPFLSSLSGLVKANNIPLTTPLYRKLYARLICTWLSGFVGKQPRPSPSLVQPEVPCTCPDCLPLNVFLADGARKTGRFPLAKPRRQHLQKNLDRARIDVSHMTERVGRPQTLVVTKTDTAYQRKMTAWRECVATAKKELAQFHQWDLREILGTKLYQIVKEGKPITYEEAQSLITTTTTTTTTREAGYHLASGGLTPNVLQPTAGNNGGSSKLLDIPASATLPKIGDPSAGMAPQSLPPLRSVIGVKRPAPDSENIIDSTGDSE